MREYLTSICLHIILILLLLFPFLKSVDQENQLENVLLVDFSKNEILEVTSTKKHRASTKKTQSLPKKIIATEKIPDQKPEQVTSTQLSKVQKQIKKSKTLPTVKNKMETTPLEEVSKIVADKLIGEIKGTSDINDTNIEIEPTAKNVSISEDKVAQFKDLIDRATLKKNSKVQIPGNEEIKEEGIRDSGNAEDGFIKGSLGARKVLHVPIIKDDSQKHGRVVVKICVDSSGKVMSSDYTQIGSTTNDAYLIELAEKGAAEYVFSPSLKSKECDKVIIDFELK